jgi:hypothetical protein
MNKYIIKILIVAGLSFGIMNNTIAQTSIQSQLTNLNLAALLNKPIDSLIAVIPAGYTEIMVTSGCNAFLAGGIVITYPNNFCIDISAKDFQFVTRHNVNHLQPAIAWPVNLMRKEKIGSVTIYKNWLALKSAGD